MGSALKDLKERRSRRIVFLCVVTAFAPAAVWSAGTAPPNTTVYVGRTGTKYHRFDCGTLKSVKNEMSLDEAVLAGYGPCRVCNPPVSSVVPGKNSAFYRVDIENLDSYRQADTKKMLRGRVTRHIDGDTVHITIENPPPGLDRVEKVRMIGADTPETVHPSREVEYFGREASDFTKKALLGKDVFLALDWEMRDKYGRLLAYIYLPDAACHNAELIRQGYAHAYTRFPFQFLEEFRGLEQEARAAKAGLWAGG
jgi:micrococcal nuclease